MPDSWIFLWIAASAADAAGATHNGIKLLLANGVSTFFIKGKPVFCNSPKSLPKNPPDCPLLCYWVFENFILADESFAKALWIFETCVLVNNNVCRKMFPSLASEATFDESFKVT